MRDSNLDKYKLYLDESGDANLTSEDKYLVLAGVIVDDKEDINWESYFNYIQKKYNLSEDEPFHTVELFEFSDSEYYLDGKSCNDLVSSLREFIDISPINIQVFYTDKDDLKEYLPIDDYDDYFNFPERGKRHRFHDIEISYEILASAHLFHFADLLSEEKSIGEVIAESRQYADRFLLRTYINSQNPQKFTENDIKSRSRELRKRVSLFGFEEKTGLRGGLEVTDLVAYAASCNLRINGPVETTERLKGVWSERGIAELWEAVNDNAMVMKISQSSEKKKERFSSYMRKNRANEISERLKKMQKEANEE